LAASKLIVGRDVLIFFEDRDRDTFFRGDRRLRRRLRKAVAVFRPKKQHVTGFEISFLLLCRALRLANQTIHVNDFALARRNPDFPVAICGYTHVLDNWKLPNPAVLGPGLYDHPKQSPKLMQDPRFFSYLMLCDWMRDMFATVYDKDALRMWFGGIDLQEWPDTKGHPKDVDMLVYDKIRWKREHYEPALLQPVLAELSRRNLRYEVLRYGRYTHAAYRKLLGRSRSMIFLCENETQGMAYQEAMASNVPILAWDQGYWLDPNRERWSEEPVPATSVPYFSERCGERFVAAADFAPALERFMERLESYTPRAYVEEHLSLRESAELFMEAYRAAAAKRRRISSDPVPTVVSKITV
jgi:glycosyltransferase involved in cell wall biosynthesis